MRNYKNVYSACTNSARNSHHANFSVVRNYLGLFVHGALRRREYVLL